MDKPKGPNPIPPTEIVKNVVAGASLGPEVQGASKPQQGAPK